MSQFALHGHIQHRRIRDAARSVLLTRLIEGAGCWLVLYFFFRSVTVSAWIVDVVFLAYAVANILLFFPQRDEAMTPGLVWLDIAVNLLPMAAAAQWSGGLSSPLLPAFVIQIGSYGMIYGVDIG